MRPSMASQTSDEISAVAHELARALEADHPDLVVSDMKKALRGGKVLVDWSQNNGVEDHDRAVLAARARPPDGGDAAHLARAPLTRPEATRIRRGADAPHEAARSARRSVREDTSTRHLGVYRSMRDASKTPEPMGGKKGARKRGAGDTFVIQEHHTPGRVHFDFRLEKDGVLVSWAVPKNVPARSGSEPPGRAHRRPPARVRVVRGHDPEGRVRRRHVSRSGTAARTKKRSSATTRSSSSSTARSSTRSASR